MNIFGIPLLLLVFSYATHEACATVNAATPILVTMCDLYAAAENYSGKLIVVRASVAGGDLWIDDFSRSGCPSWTKVVLVLPNAHAELIRDSAYREFFRDIKSGMSVEARFEGRLDVAFVWRNHRRVFLNGYERKGFGKLGDAGAQIVLQRVSDVMARPRSRR
jgi:hypothetical protein